MSYTAFFGLLSLTACGLPSRLLTMAFIGAIGVAMGQATADDGVYTGTQKLQK